MLTIELWESVNSSYIEWVTTDYTHHRHHNVAEVMWHSNGQKWIEEYWVNGEPHRDPTLGPAVTSWHDDGQKEYEKYCVHGRKIDLGNCNANHRD